MTTLLLAIATFPGGNFNDLAASLAEATGRPAVVSLSSARGRMKSFSFDAADEDAFSRTVLKEIGLMRAPGVTVVFHDGQLPSARVSQRAWNQPETVAAKAFSADSVKAGRVTFRTEKTESLDLKTLAGFAKPVVSHWYFEGLAIGVSAKDVPEMEFLSLVAKGIGGRFLNTSAAFKIDIDPAEIRSRAVRTIQAEAMPTESDGASLQNKERAFRIAALNAISNEEISRLLAQPGNTVRVAVRNGSPVESAAVALIREMEAQQLKELRAERTLEDARRTGESLRAVRRDANFVGILNRVDSRRQAMLVINQRFEASLEVPVVDARGRPSTERLFGSTGRRRGRG